jgi:hypothetical protein
MGHEMTTSERQLKSVPFDADRLFEGNVILDIPAADMEKLFA